MLRMMPTFLFALLMTGTIHLPAQQSLDDWILKTQQTHQDRDYQAAFDAATEAIKLDPKLSALYYLRGRSAFCIGRVKDSAADFDRYIELRPDLKQRQWERGLTLYYANRFVEGAKQFEEYQDYYDNDVENSVWRFICLAKVEGVDKARETIMPIENDSRIPMMEIYELFRGKATPEDVFERAKSVAGPNGKVSMFYANLYVGLYMHAIGNEASSQEFIGKAHRDYKIDHYMWNVAEVHLKLLPLKAGK